MDIARDQIMLSIWIRRVLMGTKFKIPPFTQVIVASESSSK